MTNTQTQSVPHVLSQEEIEYLKQPLKRKQYLAFSFLISGILMILIALIIFLTGFQVQGFSFTVIYQNEPKVVNISPIFSFILTFLGLWLISRYRVNKNSLRENSNYLPNLSRLREPVLVNSVESDGSQQMGLIKVRSFSSSRFVAAMILLLMSLIFALQFGVSLSGENHVGNWAFLGGPTLFFPTSLIPTIIGIGLLCYTLFSASIITFSKTPHFYQIEEYRFMAPWMTEIPIQDVKAIRFTNGCIGPKLFWVFVFGVQIVMLYVDGIMLLVNPLNFGNAFVAAGAYIGSATIQLIVMFILLLKTPTYLEIVTEEKLYELQFSPPSFMPLIRNSIEKLFDIPALTEKSKSHHINNVDLNPEENSFPTLQNIQIKDWYQSTFGIGLFLIAFISQIYAFYVGEWLRIVFYLFGVLFCVRGFKMDFSSSRSKLRIFHHQSKQELYIRREWCWMNEVFRFNNVKKEEINLRIKIKKFDFYDFIAAILIPIFLGIDIGATLKYAIPDTISVSFPIIHILLGCIILLGLIYFLILPRPALCVDSGSIHYEYHLPGIQMLDFYKNEKSPISRGMDLCKAVIKSNRKECIIRILIPVGSLIIACLIFIASL